MSDGNAFAVLRGARRVWAIGSIHGEAGRLRQLHLRDLLQPVQLHLQAGQDQVQQHSEGDKEAVRGQQDLPLQGLPGLLGDLHKLREQFIALLLGRFPLQDLRGVHTLYQRLGDQRGVRPVYPRALLLGGLQDLQDRQDQVQQQTRGHEETMREQEHLPV